MVVGFIFGISVFEGMGFGKRKDEGGDCCVAIRIRGERRRWVFL